MKTFDPRFKKVRNALALVPFILLAAPVNVHAVVFTEATITGESDILNPAGTLIVANNFGPNPIATTANGVSFGTDASDLTSSNWAVAPQDFSSSFGGGTPLDQLLSGLQFVAGNPPTTGVLTIDGLTAGKSYLLQLLFANELNTAGDNISVGLDVGGSPYSLGLIDRSINLRVSFTADDSTLTTSFLPIGSFPTGNSIINAYALHQVPEPATVLIFGAGLVGLAMSRRRRK